MFANFILFLIDWPGQKLCRRAMSKFLIWPDLYDIIKQDQCVFHNISIMSSYNICEWVLAINNRGHSWIFCFYLIYCGMVLPDYNNILQGFFTGTGIRMEILVYKSQEYPWVDYKNLGKRKDLNTVYIYHRVYCWWILQ